MRPGYVIEILYDYQSNINIFINPFVRILVDADVVVISKDKDDVSIDGKVSAKDVDFSMNSV